MYCLTPGYRIPAIQRGLSRAETLLTKVNAGLGSAALMSAAIAPPPAWTFAAVGATAAVLNLAPGPRSLARWSTIGYRHLRERDAPDNMAAHPGTTASWSLHPGHGTMQDPQRRAGFHDAFARALTFAGGQSRNAGVQVHVTHHTTARDYTDHTQTITVHVPKGLISHPDRVIDSLEHEFASLGVLARLTPQPLLVVTERGASWAGLDDGRFVSTARITAWPEETDGTLMPILLLAPGTDRSLAVLYRPLPVGLSRRSAKWQRAASDAFTNDKVKQDAHDIASGTTHGALVQGATLVDLDAYLTVFGDSPETVTEARWQASLMADRHRIRLDWLPGQQHRAHVMTTPHGASTRKGAIL